MESTHVIYGLFDPNSLELRYVGFTSHIKSRYREHHCLRNLKGISHKNNWIKLLLSKGQKAEIFILERYDSAELLPQAEIEQIEYYKSIGCRLTNSTIGGEGICGKKHSEETKRKMSLAAKGKIISEEQRRKTSTSLKGRKRTKPFSPEAIKNDH